MVEKGYLAESMTDVTVKQVRKERKWFERKKKEKAKVEYYPSPNSNHFFMYKGTKLWAFSHQEKMVTVGWNNKPDA